MAGGSIINGKKRVTAVRFNQCDTKKILAPVDEGLGDHGEGVRDGPEERGGARDDWEELASKSGQLEKRVKEYLDDQQGTDAREPPIVRSPTRMTPEEWAKHQVIHTPYSSSCRHCVAARAVRYRHPKTRRHKYLVKDVDGSREGPVKVSLDYMYLNERVKGDKDGNNNQPNLVMVEHRFGRIWAYRVPNKGVWGKVEWVKVRTTPQGW